MDRHTLRTPHDTHPRLRENNFDLLRLLFAAAVCLVHASQLSGFAELRPIDAVLSSAVAVKSFFVVSGFLIFMSFERSSSLRSYMQKRVRRIYPAYFTVVVLCALGLVAVSTKDVAGFFSAAWLKYLASNLAFLNFLQPTLPGVFESNLMPAVNGALWTLKIEVMFYLSVPLFVAAFRRAGLLPVLVVTYCGSVAFAALMNRIGQSHPAYLELGRQLPGQLSYFMAGAFFYYFLPLFERRAGWFVAIAVAILLVDVVSPQSPLEPFALATVVVFFGLFSYRGNFGKYGDFSYGVYIVHFPIIQLLLNGGRFAERPWEFLASVVALTALGGVAMWHLVEKRFLARGSHYVAVAK